MQRLLVAAMLIGGLSACKVAPTAIVVAIDSDYAVPGELSSLLVNLTKSGRAQPQQSLALTGTAPYRLPLSFAVVPEGDKAGELTVEIVAQDGQGRTLVRSTRVTHFLPNQTRVLPIVLTRRCASLSCSASETCTEQGCQSPVVDPSALAQAVPGKEFDGVIVPDAGPAEADASEADASEADARQPDTGILDSEADAGIPEPDAGSADSGAAPDDAGSPDGAAPDALVMDAAPVDSGASDSGPPDAGPSDAGFPDLGSPDAGFADTGADAGSMDATCTPPMPATTLSQIGELTLQHAIDMPLLVADLDNDGQDEFVAASSVGEFSIIRFDGCGGARVTRHTPNAGPFIDGPVFIDLMGARTLAFVQDDGLLTFNVQNLSQLPTPGFTSIRPDGGLGVDGGALGSLSTLQASPVAPYELLVHSRLEVDALINSRTGATALFSTSPLLPPITTRPPYMARDAHGSAFAQFSATNEIMIASLDGTFHVVTPFMRIPALATQPVSFSLTGSNNVWLFEGQVVATSQDLAGHQINLPFADTASFPLSNFPFNAIGGTQFGGEPTISVNALANRIYFYQTGADGGLYEFDCPLAGGPGCYVGPTMTGINPAIPLITVHFPNEPIPVAIAAAGTELRVHIGTYWTSYGLLSAPLSAGPAYTINYWPRYGAVGGLLAMPLLGRRLALFGWSLESINGPPDPSTVWPQFRHDAQRSGHAQY